MATEWHDPDQEDISLLAQTISEYFPEISGLPVPLVIDIRMAVNDDKKGAPALKRNGHRCAAKIEIVKAEERSKGGPDIRLKIDKKHWLTCDDESEKAATLHSELMRLVPKYDGDTGSPKLDSYGRPDVKLRPYDWSLAGFAETIRVFEKSAPERQAIDRVEISLQQMVLPFAAAEPREAAIAKGG